MPVKYVCPKCGRRFAEWGAEKFGFKCPGDEWCPKDRPEEIELVRVGLQEEKSAKKPTLKRPTRRAAAVPSSMNEDELLVPDIEDIEADTEIEEDEFEEVEGDDEEAIEVDEVAKHEPVADEVTEVEEDDLGDEEAGGLEVDGSVDVDDSLEDAEDIVEDDWKE